MSTAGFLKSLTYGLTANMTLAMDAVADKETAAKFRDSMKQWDGGKHLTLDPTNGTSSSSWIVPLLAISAIGGLILLAVYYRP